MPKISLNSVWSPLCLWGLAFLFLSFPSNAQVVNFGTAYVSENALVSIVSEFDNKESGEFNNDGEIYFYNNFNNDGVFDFFNPGGLSRFVGSAEQDLSGKASSYFYDIQFSNRSSSMPFQLSNYFNVDGEVNFDRGIVNNRDIGGEMVFSEDAEHYNTSDRSHVNGPVIKIGQSPFIYPIGDEGYYRLAGLGNLASHRLISGEYLYKDPNPDYPTENREPDITQIDDQEFWIINEAEEHQEQQMLTLSYHDVTTPSIFINAARHGYLVIARWDEVENQWVNEGGVSNLSDYTVSTEVDKLGIFTLAIAEPQEVGCEVIVYNLVDMTQSSQNTYMRIHTKCAENMIVKVYNRWGVKVFETNDYGPTGDVFDGYSDGRLTLSRHSGLPTGTYFYVIEYEYDTGLTMQKGNKVGYVYVLED